MQKKLPYISLFSGGGIGDTGFVNAGLSPIIMSELEQSRANLLSLNFPDSKIIVGDVNNQIDNITKQSREILKKIDEELFLISATPPCQGMSKNGIGSLLKAIKEGKRPSIDERNLLFKPAIELVQRLKPKYFFFENVDRMINQFYYDNNNKVPMVEYIENQLERIGYLGTFKIVNFAEYGVPQNRLRLIGLFSRNDINPVRLPDSTHSSNKDLFNENFITLYEAIGHLPPLDSINKEAAESDYHPLHKTSVSRPQLYQWIKHTEEGNTAFNNNTCTKCAYISDKLDIYCQNCGDLLPKPVVEKDGELRLIRGYISSYKRMRYDRVAPTVTTRSAYASSDNNIHPTQNRVLSIYEIAILQGLNVTQYKWRAHSTDKYPNITVLRDILGEPVSPIITSIIGHHLIQHSKK